MDQRPIAASLEEFIFPRFSHVCVYLSVSLICVCCGFTSLLAGCGRRTSFQTFQIDLLLQAMKFISFGAISINFLAYLFFFFFLMINNKDEGREENLSM